MRDFSIHMTHRPGELARIAEVLARVGVNIKSVAALTVSNQAVLRLIADDVAAARTALTNNNIPFEEHELVTVLLENQAGQLADVAVKLGSAGVNLDAAYVVGLEDNLIELAISVDNVKKAKKALE